MLMIVDGNLTFNNNNKPIFRSVWSLEVNSEALCQDYKLILSFNLNLKFAAVFYTSPFIMSNSDLD